MGRLPAFSHELRLLAGQFSRLQIFRYVPASKFARPPDRSYRCNTPQGSRGFYVRAYRALLPPHAPDMLTVRTQVIDGTGTFTLLDSQPCRLLRFPALRSPICFMSRLMRPILLGRLSALPTPSFPAEALSLLGKRT